MKIYLDNNIIVSIENEEYSLDSVLDLIPGDKKRLYFSSAHIFELDNFNGSNRISKEELNIQRFSTLRRLTKNNYLFIDPQNDDRITHRMIDPSVCYDTIASATIGKQAIKHFTNIASEYVKEEVRNDLGLISKEINNKTDSEIIDHLNTVLTNAKKESFQILVDKTLSNSKDETPPFYERCAVLFELLDLYGYWKDNPTENSNTARLWDSFHATFASNGDYFISDDQKTRIKTAAVYKIYNVKTKIIAGPRKRKANI